MNLPALEDGLSEAANKHLKGMTLWRTEKGWQASAYYRGAKGWQVVINEDLLAALHGLLGVQAQAKPPAPADEFGDLLG